MKKILLVAGHSRRAFKWGMIGEAAKRIMEDSELYYFDCNNVPKGYCGTNDKPHPFYCLKCRNNCLKVVRHAGIKPENILKMKKVHSPKFPLFKNAQESVNYVLEQYELGLGATSCLMSITRDYDFDTKKWQKPLNKFFRTEYQVIKNLEALFDKYNFDEIHTFNGRMPFVYAAIEYARKHNIPFVLYESARDLNRINIARNSVFHDFNFMKECIARYWENAGQDKDEIACSWFDERRMGVIQGAGSFTKDQIRYSLPEGFDKSKENIVFFNSSIDEVYAFDSWKHPFADNENEIIEAVLEHYKNDTSKHFYIRIHPNLAGAQKKHATQLEQIRQIKQKYPNLTIIGPKEKIDTYAMIQAATKTITAYSTVGCEATYWGTVSILAGKAPYEDFDCAYIAKSMDELYALIDDKSLKPKPKENSYPYGYFFKMCGEPTKYFKRTSHCDGDFCGMHIVSK